MSDEFLAARILSLRCGREQLYKILRLGRGLRPGFGRSGQKKLLQLFLAASQGRLIGLKFMQTLTADLRRFLCRHTAVLVEVDRIICHGIHPFLLFVRALPDSIHASIRLPVCAGMLLSHDADFLNGTDA